MEKLGNILLGFKDDGEPFLLKELNVQGAATAVLKEALLPNLVQTMENGPALIHGGPFANIAQGANSIMATKLAQNVADYVLTEAGFGFDLGAEKFFDIVCQYGNFRPSAVVLVATVRAPKLHGGVNKDELQKPNPDAVWKGRENLEKHIENARKFGMEPLVAVNRFLHDTDEELKTVLQICRTSGAESAIADGWARGGRGGVELAEKLLAMLAANKSSYQPLYRWDLPVEEKIERVAKEIYGAAAVDYLPKAKDNLKTIYKCGYDKLPICIAKTQNSLSDNPRLLGRPTDFTVTVREIIISAGAGFLVPLTGEMMRMPGLPRKPAAEVISITDEGNITGLF
jgi:formate--tetrahydrofolate ligase